MLTHLTLTKNTREGIKVSVYNVLVLQKVLKLPFVMSLFYRQKKKEV